jgi:hypothetical protein
MCTPAKVRFCLAVQQPVEGPSNAETISTHELARNWVSGPQETEELFFHIGYIEKESLPPSSISTPPCVHPLLYR